MPQDDDYSTDDLQVQVFDGLLALTRHSMWAMTHLDVLMLPSVCQRTGTEAP